MNCAISELSPYTPNAEQPWNDQRIVHLFRRTSFGADIDRVVNARNADPVDLINNIIAEGMAVPLSPEPDYAGKIKSEYGLALLESVLQKDAWARSWIMELQKNGLRGRMAVFWHNHFVTRFDIYESSSYMYQYHKLLQTHALGNFKDFVREIGLTPAMLVFLNGTQNVAGDPNENYAREVYELFTLGVDNGYTQQDIEETARAFTGYTDIPDEWGPIFFDEGTHDGGEKTIFGRTGNWGYDDVINILFEERALEISLFIAEEIYKRFVNPLIDEVMIAELAAVFRESDWEIAELLKAMLSSTHFFDEKNMGTVIEGHLEHTLLFYNERGVEINGLTVLGIYADATTYGQALFNPVDVAGWPGNRSWLNTESIAYRWNYMESQVGIYLVFSFGALGDFVRSISSETVDVRRVCEDVIRYFIPRGFQFEADYEEALSHFKGEIPGNYFEDGTWTTDYWALPIQFHNLYKYIVKMPEYQLK